MNNINLTFAPTAEDLISTALCAGSAYYFKTSPSGAAIEQFGSILVGKNISNNTSMFDRSSPDVLVQEYDLWTGASRGIYSAFNSRPNSRVARDAISGGVSNIAARYLAQYINLSVPKL